MPLHLPAVREALGCLIPPDLHPSFDGKKPRAKHGQSAKTAQVYLYANTSDTTWRVNMLEEEGLTKGLPVTKGMLEFFLLAFRESLTDKSFYVASHKLAQVLRQENSAAQVEGGSSALVQQIEYRKTGVILNVEPIIYEGGRVDLKISQELSSSGGESGLNPNISTRSIKTVVSLKDGESVLLAGLISKENNEGNSGVPILKDIPFIGRFFRFEESSASRKELMLLIVPYVMESQEKLVQISREVMALMPLFTQEREELNDNTD